MSHIGNSALKLRDTFRIVNKENLQWFPGHMGKGLKQMQQKLKQVDCIIEVHDARIPISGRNPNFKHTISSIKPHILVLNKKDLISSDIQTKIMTQSERLNASNIIFTNCKDVKCVGVKRILPLAQEIISKSYRHYRSETKNFCIMVIGVPNVGKSSLVNILRNRHLHKAAASQVGAVPGITRSVQNKIKISEDPLIYLLDTPGILTPNVTDIETALKLTLCACLQEHRVGPEIIADYLLFWLNRQQNFSYVQFLNLQKPTDNITELLTTVAHRMNKIKKIKDYKGEYVTKFDLHSTALYFVQSFRNGELGKICLDRDIL